MSSSKNLMGKPGGLLVPSIAPGGKGKAATLAPTSRLQQLSRTTSHNSSFRNLNDDGDDDDEDDDDSEDSDESQDSVSQPAAKIASAKDLDWTQEEQQNGISLLFYK